MSVTTDCVSVTMCVCIYRRDLFKMPSRDPALDGVLDKRLGVSNKKDTCDVRGQPPSPMIRFDLWTQLT